MKERSFDPSRLDVQAFARAASALSGQWPQQRMQRLCAGLATALDDAGAPDIVWNLRGEERQRSGARAETWLHLQARCAVVVLCQRCLMRMQQPLEVQRSFLFVADEAEAERLDEESDDDVMVLTRSLDLAELVEDELILALPLVPRHNACPEPLLDAAQAALDERPRPHPFAVLQTLRDPGPKS